MIKLDARLTMAPLEHLCEWVACVVGRKLGITTADPYRVQLSLDFAGGIQDPAVKHDILRSLGVVFGAGLFEGYSPWPTGERLPADLRTPASELLAFDMFIHNVDRRRDNPNMMAARSSLAAYDHGDAFAFLLPNLDPKKIDPAVDPLPSLVEQHVFRVPLKGVELPLERFREALGTLTDAFFRQIRAAAPAQWQKGAADGKLDRIIEVLRARRDAASEWLPRVAQQVRT